jgi:hypothetical protein
MRDLKTLAPVISVFAVIILLFIWGVASKNETIDYVPGTNVACLPNGHQNLADHIHPLIAITVDGVPETVPADIGITPDCMAEIHTHEADGVIHVETVKGGRLGQLALSDFFSVWGRPLERPGFHQTLLVDGVAVTDPSQVRFKDDQRIGIVYTSIAQ